MVSLLKKSAHIGGSLSSYGAIALAYDGGTTQIGSSTRLIIHPTGIINVRNTTDATHFGDGSLQTNGGLSVTKNAIIGNDVKLLSDNAVLSLGADSDATFTHDGTTGLTILLLQYLLILLVL